MRTKSQEPKPKSLFDHLNEIKLGKSPDYYHDLTEQEKKNFNQYVILMGLGMDENCLDVVAIISKYLNIIPDEQFYEVCRTLVPSTRKFTKWIKSGKSKVNKEILQRIAEYYEIGISEAAEACEVYSDDELKYVINGILGRYGYSEKEIKELMK
jgi:hypothetical protein